MTTPIQPAQRTQPTAAPGEAARNEATARAFFAAYTKGDAAAMTASLDPKTTYDDPSFGHLDGKATVGEMWGLIAGGGTHVDAAVKGLQMGPDGKSATVNVVESYQFLGNPIQNHITSTFTFGPDGKITSQRDQFSWKDWGKQTGLLSPVLQTPIGHVAVRLLLRSQLAYASLKADEVAKSADLGGISDELRAQLAKAVDELQKQSTGWIP